jgi:hypothetical protein
MLNRLGDVFYWIGNIVAALVVLAGVRIGVYHQDEVTVALVGGVVALRPSAGWLRSGLKAKSK